MTNVQPVKPTIGQHLDAVLIAAGHDVSLAEADAKGYIETAFTWIKGEWHNLVTAGSTLYMALHLAGKL
jgi:hypothetical protein